MSGSARRSEAASASGSLPGWLVAVLIGLGAVLASTRLLAEVPARVVSINLCTDQLAMLLADPGQLISVSHLAQDERSSVMAEAARAYPSNQAQAEEVYLLNPDLVLAGTFTSGPTLSMLERLDIPVVRLSPPSSLADVRTGMIEVGKALGQTDRAEAMVREFDLALARHPATDLAQAPTAATYAANGYTPGPRSLSAEIIETAGFRHLARELGLEHGGVLPLEALVLAAPDLVVLGETYPGNSRAEEILSHPVLANLKGGRETVEDRDWVCGLPSVIDAIDRMRAARDLMDARE